MEALRKIPQYYGRLDEDAEDWLNTVSNIIKLQKKFNGPGAQQKNRLMKTTLFESALEENAKKWCQSMPANTRSKLSTLKAAFRVKFIQQVNQDREIARLEARKQRENEKVEDYAYDVKKMISKIYGAMPQNFQANIFIKGLKSGLMEKVAEKYPLSMDQAINEAINMESVMERLNLVKNQSKELENTKEIEELKSVIREMTQKIRILETNVEEKKGEKRKKEDKGDREEKKQRIEKTTIFCRHCGKVGHIQRNCFQLKRFAKTDNRRFDRPRQEFQQRQRQPMRNYDNQRKQD